MGKLKEKLKKNKKKVIILTVVIVIAIILLVNNLINANKEEEPAYEIGEIERQDLTTSISATGKITTEETKNVNSQLVGYKLTGVNVKVGDTVNVGDILCTFDTEDLAKTVADTKATINALNEQGNIGIAGAERSLQDAQSNKDYNLKVPNEQVENAKKAHDSKLNEISSAETVLAQKKAELAVYEPTVKAYENAKKDKEEKQKAVDNAQKALNEAQSSGVSDLTALQSALNLANQALTSSADALQQAEAKYNSISEIYNTKNQAVLDQTANVNKLKGELNGLYKNYQDAVESYNYQAASIDSGIASANDALQNTKLQTSTSTLSTQTQLETMEKQLAEGNLASTVSGTVTAVNVKAGDTYSGGTLITIEGVQTFIVEAEIDEYDIADIKENMEVVIKTDATRDEELKGKVIFVAPSATEANAMAGMSAVSTTSSNATYKIKIEILDYNERLRLGMNAKLSIILDKVENALVVPYDAITEEDGKKYITVIDDDENTEMIEVTTGLESGYYSEIKSDKIKEGMQIVLPEVDGTSTLDELLDSMGATGGI